LKKKVFILGLIILFITGCAQAEGNDEKTELTISAAASMMESLNEIKDLFEQEHPDIKITYNFGGSGTLRKQIEQGGPIDLFFSASKKDYELLADAGLVKDGAAVLENNLVVIQPESAELDSFEAFLETDGQLAIGTPEAVPAGTYAKEALEAMNVWTVLEGEKRLVFTKDVQQALIHVRENSVDAGIVYLSDVVDDNKIKVLEEIDGELHSPIEYFAAVIQQDGRNEAKTQAAELFFDFVQKDVSMEVFEEHGFKVTNKEERDVAE